MLLIFSEKCKSEYRKCNNTHIFETRFLKEGVCIIMAGSRSRSQSLLKFGVQTRNRVRCLS